MPGHDRTQDAARGRPQRGQQRGEDNVMNATPLQGLQSDALRMLTMREGCPQEDFQPAQVK